MAIPAHLYQHETVMRQAFMNIDVPAKGSPLLTMIYGALVRHVGSTLRPGVTKNLIRRKRRG